MRKVTILLAISALIAAIGCALLGFFQIGSGNLMTGINTVFFSFEQGYLMSVWSNIRYIGLIVLTAVLGIVFILWLCFIIAKKKPAQLLSLLVSIVSSLVAIGFYIVPGQVGLNQSAYYMGEVLLLGIMAFSALLLIIFSWINCFRMPFAENISYLEGLVPDDKKVNEVNTNGSLRDEIRDIIASELRDYRLDRDLRQAPQPAPYGGAAINGPLLVQYINTTQPNPISENPAPTVVVNNPQPTPQPVVEPAPVKEEPKCECKCEEKPASIQQPIIIPVVMPPEKNYVPPKEQIVVPIILEERYLDEEETVPSEPQKEEPKVEEVPLVEDEVKEVEAPLEEVSDEPVVVEETTSVQEEPAPVEEVVEEQNVEETDSPKNPIIRIPFQERMKTADKSIRDNYNDLKNYILSYGVKSRISNSGDTFRLHTKTYVKMTIAGKGLKLYLALDPKDYENTTIPVLDAGHKGIYEEIPLVFKVKSDLSVKRAKQLIDDAMAKDNFVQGEIGDTDWAKEFDN